MTILLTLGFHQWLFIDVTSVLGLLQCVAVHDFASETSAASPTTTCNKSRTEVTSTVKNIYIQTFNNTVHCMMYRLYVLPVLLEYFSKLENLLLLLL